MQYTLVFVRISTINIFVKEFRTHFNHEQDYAYYFIWQIYAYFIC